jgi:hypothetical protein
MTGGAGFIGSNFVGANFSTGCARATSRCSTSTLTYAGNLENLADAAGRSRATSSCRATSATARCSTAARCSTGRAPWSLRRREPRRPQHPRPGEFIQTNVEGTFTCSRRRAPTGRRSRRPQGGVPLPARLDRRGLRFAGQDRRALHRDPPTSRTARIRRARRRATTWCAPGTTPTACRC